MPANGPVLCEDIHPGYAMHHCCNLVGNAPGGTGALEMGASMTEPWIVSTTPHETFNFYTRANIGEVFPDPVAPLSFSWFESDGTIGGSEIGM